MMLSLRQQQEYFHERYDEEKKEEEDFEEEVQRLLLLTEPSSSTSSPTPVAVVKGKPSFSSSSSSSVADSQTSVTSYKETEHARLRRQQRGIDQKDLKAAIRYGTRRPHIWGHHHNHTKKQNHHHQQHHHHSSRRNDPNVYRYSYNDIHYIVNDTTKEEITCYTTPITLEPVLITEQMEEMHLQAIQTIQEDLNSWTSHTVMVIDTSGSMRNSDMWGSRNRLQGVWMSIALDFVAQRLESGTGTSTDVISIITMGGGDHPEPLLPQILFREVPTTWVLYNEIVTMYNRQLSKPQGHGYFVPSLLVAEELLKRNTNASCAAALIFLSDGAPSDTGPMKHQMILETVESLAQQFGRRLVFTAVGFGALDAFDTLQNMVDAAKDYGTIAELKLPGMTSSSLGVTFTSIATSLTSTQTEMTELGGGSNSTSTIQRKVRDVCRESRKKASQPLAVISTEDFDIYHCSNVKRTVRIEAKDSFGRKYECYEAAELQHPNARFVAISKGAFGEGAERFAYRFYELADDGRTIVGVPMVAKESRMVSDAVHTATTSKKDARKKFEDTFIMTQQIASRLAKRFNEHIQTNPRIHKNTPQISFLDCSVYELNDSVIGKYSVLVENRLDQNQWYKWNSNNGLVNGIRQTPMILDTDLDNEPKPSVTTTTTTSTPLMYPYNHRSQDSMTENLALQNLDIIEEGSEEEDYDELEEKRHDRYISQKSDPTILFTASQVAQAFSHFSYHQSDCKRLVCDLQGVYDTTKHVLFLSDPVIHYHNKTRTDRKCIHGRTDRGWDGIQDFFQSHCCTDQGGLCQLITHGFKSVSTTKKSQPRIGIPGKHQHP